MRTIPGAGEPALTTPVPYPGSGLHIRTAESGRLVLARVSGPLDLATVPSFVNRLQSLHAPRRRLVLDLRDVDYIDSDGVRALLHVQEDLEADAGEIRLVVRPGSRVARTLSLLRLEQRFPIFDGVLDAWIRRRKSATC